MGRYRKARLRREREFCAIRVAKLQAQMPHPVGWIVTDDASLQLLRGLVQRVRPAATGRPVSLPYLFGVA